MAKRKMVVKAHGRPTRKDGKRYRGTCRKCGRDHSTSAHWSHAMGPKTKGPRGGTSYKTTRKTKGKRRGMVVRPDYSPTPRVAVPRAKRSKRYMAVRADYAETPRVAVPRKGKKR